MIVQNASAVGIGTAGNCVAGPTPANSGTSITHAPLQDAIAAVCSGLDNFQCYRAQPRRLPIELRDQFEDPNDPDDVETALINRGRRTTTFCNPVIKNGEPIIDKGAHLTCYPMRSVPPFARRDVFVQNQLQPGLQRLTVRRPRSLCLPSQKDAPDPENPNKALPPPIALDHFKCYRVSGRPVTQSISLEDQFGTKETVVGRPKLLCNPVEKVIGAETVGIANPLSHLVCYRILARLPGANLMVQARNQFGVQKLKIGRSRTLCVRSAKFP